MSVDLTLANLINETKAAKAAERGRKPAQPTDRPAEKIPGHAVLVEWVGLRLDTLMPGHGPAVEGPEFTKYDLPVCPYKADDQDDGHAGVLVYPDGSVVAKCFHAYCEGLTQPEGWELQPTLANAAEDFGGVQLSAGKVFFDRASDAANLLLLLGISVNIPPSLQASKTMLELQKDGRYSVEIESLANAAVPGWATDKSKKARKIVGEPTPEAEPIDVSVTADSVLRVVKDPATGKTLGLYMPGKKDGKSVWLPEDMPLIRPSINDLCGSELVDAILNMARSNPYWLDCQPFAPEFPGGRKWNLRAPQLAFTPADEVNPWKCRHWLRVLHHCGRNLTPTLRTHAWGKVHARSGMRYNLLWAANLFRHWERPLPLLYFYGPSNSGKSTFQRAHELLFKDGVGVSQIDAALVGRDQFNAELLNVVLGYSQETDLSENKTAYDKIKQFVEDPMLPIRAMQRSRVMVRNLLHIICTSQKQLGVKIDHNDTRLTISRVDMPQTDIPWPTLQQKLIDEAPHYLALLYSLDLPDPIERLSIPAIRPDDEKEDAAGNDPVTFFLCKFGKYDPNGELPRASVLASYNAWAAHHGYEKHKAESFGSCLAKSPLSKCSSRDKRVLVGGKQVRIYRMSLDTAAIAADQE